MVSVNSLNSEVLRPTHWIEIEVVAVEPKTGS